MTESNSRANVKYPYQKDGVMVHSELDELMLKYYKYRGTDKLHIEAYMVGQHLQMYFTVFGCVTFNQTQDKYQMKTQSMEVTYAGLEAPFRLLLDNKFYQDNFSVITSSVINELTRLATTRKLPDDQVVLASSLQLSQSEYLAVIAGIVAGSAAQASMDLEIRLFNAKVHSEALKELKRLAEKGDLEKIASKGGIT